MTIHDLSGPCPKTDPERFFVAGFGELALKATHQWKIDVPFLPCLLNHLCQPIEVALAEFDGTQAWHRITGRLRSEHARRAAISLRRRWRTGERRQRHRLGSRRRRFVERKGTSRHRPIVLAVRPQRPAMAVNLRVSRTAPAVAFWCQPVRSRPAHSVAAAGEHVSVASERSRMEVPGMEPLKRRA